MPTIPPAPRTHRITLASPSAGPFDVGFRLFESDALRVYVDGEVSTDFTVNATYAGGFDDDAQIIFNTTLDTDTVIQIDGDMTPARDDDFLNGPQLTALLNIELARVWATLSEHHMQLARAVLGLSDVGAGDAADAGGRRIRNLAAPLDDADAARLLDIQNILITAGNVPSPTLGQVGHLIQATGVDTYNWVARATIFGAALEAVSGLTPAADRLAYFTGSETASLTNFTATGRAVVALNGAANQIPYFTGPGTADLTSFTAAGRAVVGLTNTTALTTLAQSPLVAGDLPYATGPNTISRLPPGTPGYALTVATGSSLVWSAINRFVWSTPQATTSGTAFDFTNIPTTVSQIAISYANTSLSGTDDFLVQLGTGGSFVTTGYNSSSSAIAGTTASTTSTAGFNIIGASAALQTSGVIFITLVDPSTNTWAISGTLGNGLFVRTITVSGFIGLAGVLDRVRITRTGANTFDNGSVNVGYLI